MPRLLRSLWVGGLLFICIVFFLRGCTVPPNPWKSVPGDGPKLLTSFAPIYCMVKKVAPDAKVHCLLTTSGPHDYRVNSEDSIIVRDADLFFGIGLNLDEHVIFKLANTAHRLKNLVRLGPPLQEKELLYVMPDSHTFAKDPHVWLGIPQTKAMVQEIAEVLSKKFPDNKDKYFANAKKYQAELDKLLAYGESKFKDKKNRKLITAHESLLYFAKTFKLDVVAAIRTHEGEKTGAARMAKIEEDCVKQDVRVLAAEPQYSNKAITTLQANLKRKKHAVTVVEIDPIETTPTADFNDPDYYLTVMRKNIDALAKSLP